MVDKYTEKIEETLEREVTGIGNGAHINIPLIHKGKRAKILILAGHHPCEECGKPMYNNYEDLCQDCLNNYEEIAYNKGCQILAEIIQTALENPNEDEESKKVYQKYLDLLDKGKLYDHFINFIYSWNSILKRKGVTRNDTEILELLKVGKLDTKKTKEGAK